MAAVRVVVFDKTGTLTTGKPGVTDVVLARGAPPGFDENQLLGYAAALESRSEHPLAREIVRAAVDRGVVPPPMRDFVALPGRGVHAVLEGFEVWIGAGRLYAEHGALVLHRELERHAGRGTHEASGGWLGLIGMADTVRDHAAEAVRDLKALGVTRTVMLTGDNPHVAHAVAARAGIDEFHASLLPEEKVARVAQIRDAHGEVMMVGDGVNDAPALANASVGVAMGAAGSDVALESAHCVLMGEDLRNVGYALDLSRRAVRTVWWNLAFSLAVIAVLIGSVFIGGLTLPFGVVGHEGSTLIVCANGLRLLRTPRRFRQAR
jgi:Cd2+/Zn2+-exporting ATPase